MARVFNGTSDLIAANTAFLTNGTGTAFSVCAWIKHSGTASGEIYSEGNTGAAGPFFQFHCDAGGTHIEFAARSATSGSSDAITGSLVVSDNVWHHVAITQTTTSNIILFVDGAIDIAANRTALSSNGSQVFNTVTIGALVRNTTASFYTGRIAHVATWRRQLDTAVDIPALADGLRPDALPSGGPNHYWPLMGLASPEPDIGSDSTVNGTLTGTTSSVGPPQVDLATFLPSLGRRPVPMIKGPDKDKILGMRGNSY